MRRFPPPWTVEALDGGFKIVDANGQSLAYVYGHADARDAEIAKALTLDEATTHSEQHRQAARLTWKRANAHRLRAQKTTAAQSEPPSFLDL